jgi:hypothetical protein
MIKKALQVAAAICLVAAVPALAQVPPPAVDGPIEQLKPGEFIWAPEVAPQGPVSVIVSLKTQRAYAYRNGVPIGVSTVSTGKAGHETPTGVFVILQKSIVHKSNLYESAPMPFMQRLTWDGIAMHAGKLPGYPSSHGCIRLPAAFAKLLYGITKLGLTVVITDDALAPEVAPTPLALDDNSASGVSEGAYSWKPETSPSGPVSIIISGRDKRIVVFRNGIKIGWGAVRIDGPVVATEAFTLRAVDVDGAHWMRLPLPGARPLAAGEMSSEEHGRISMPDAFRNEIKDVLQPGATLLVTRDSLRSSGTGKHLTVIVAEDE